MPYIQRQRSCRSAPAPLSISSRPVTAWTLTGTRFTPDFRQPVGRGIFLHFYELWKNLFRTPAFITGFATVTVFTGQAWRNATRPHSLCDGTHTKLQLILQLEHTKRGAKAPLFLCTTKSGKCYPANVNCPEPSGWCSILLESGETNRSHLCMTYSNDGITG